RPPCGRRSRRGPLPRRVQGRARAAGIPCQRRRGGTSMTENGGPAPTPGPTDLIAWHRRMLEIRLFEEKVQELFQQGLIQGTTHLCQGQEAVSVGAISALRPDDYLTITYRGHGHALARGMAM